MPVFHYYALRAFAHETEDAERVRRAVRNVARGVDVGLEESPAEGTHGNRILILEAQVKSAKAERDLFESLARDDPEGYAQLEREVPRRLDEHLNFFLRVDKQAALADRLLLAQDDDAITVRARLRSFPKPGADATSEALQALQAFLLRCKDPKR